MSQGGRYGLILAAPGKGEGNGGKPSSADPAANDGEAGNGTRDDDDTGDSDGDARDREEGVGSTLKCTASPGSRGHP